MNAVVRTILFWIAITALAFAAVYLVDRAAGSPQETSSP